MKKYKQFILGFILGALTFGAVVAWANIGVLYSSNNIELGTASNPIYVTTN